MDIKNTYKNVFADIQTKKYFLVFTIFIFSLACALSVFNPPELRGILLEMVNAIRMLSQDLQTRSLLYVIVKIFTHNAIASFIALFSGALLSLIPLSMVIANGYVIGSVVIPRLSKVGLLIPHGVFELPAFVLACSYGIWLGLWPFTRGRIETVKHRLKQCAAIYFCVVVPLLIIAAAIEGSLFKYMLRH
jgi:stage II sporulation protein M